MFGDSGQSSMSSELAALNFVEKPFCREVFGISMIVVVSYAIPRFWGSMFTSDFHKIGAA